jgi:hypothetical protein
MISKSSGQKPMNLILTDNGTQKDEMTAWEKYL